MRRAKKYGGFLGTKARTRGLIHRYAPKRFVGSCNLEVVPPPPLAQRIALGLMHATQVATPFHRPGWVYEEKVDGYRIAAMKAGDGTRLTSRNGIQRTKRFRELAQALGSRFEWLRGQREALIEEREQLTRELAQLAEAVAAGGQLSALLGAMRTKQTRVNEIGKPSSATFVYTPRGGWPKCCGTSKAPAKSSLLSSPLRLW